MDKVLLIADDNKDIVDILKIYAQKEGYKTVCAYDGEQALKMQKEYNPVLILLDVMMPKINGYDVCRQIRQTSNVPIIMVTAKSEEADRILGLDIGADDYVLLPARGVFALGVGHMRRRGLRPGDKTPEPAPMQETKTVSLSGLEWKVLLSVKEQLRPEEMVEDPWALRAAQSGLEPEEYCRTAEELDRKQVIGRFATFLEHVRTRTNDGPVTKYNGLFHWTVPAGMEIRAGAECGRHICMTHCYWRTGGDIFGGAQIMGVVHGLEKNAVLEHKAAIDRHLDASGIPVLHTAVFWGERSEIKPSEISPDLYRKWTEEVKSAPVLR